MDRKRRELGLVGEPERFRDRKKRTKGEMIKVRERGFPSLKKNT